MDSKEVTEPVVIDWGATEPEPGAGKHPAEWDHAHWPVKA